MFSGREEEEGVRKTEGRDINHHTKLRGKKWSLEKKNNSEERNSITQSSRQAASLSHLRTEQTHPSVTPLSLPDRSGLQMMSVQQVHRFLMNTAATLQREGIAEASHHKHEVPNTVLPIYFHPSFLTTGSYSAAQANLKLPVILLPQFQKCCDKEEEEH